METPSAMFVPIGQTEEGIILQNTETGETKIQKLDPSAQRRRAKAQNAPVKPAPFYDLSHTQMAQDNFLRANPGSTPEDYQTILSIREGVRTGNPDLMMSVGQGAAPVESALMSVEGTGAALQTEPKTEPQPGTSAQTDAGDGLTVNADGSVTLNRSQFDRLLGQSEAGFSQALQATKKAASVDYEDQAKKLADAQKEMRENYDKKIREYEALLERQQIAEGKARYEMRVAEQELKDGTIDPNRAFGGLGGRVAAAFATALGAFAQGISGGKIPNTAMQIIDGAINRDIFAQKEEMKKRKDVLMNKNNVYAQMMRRFGDERIAEQAAINMGYKAAEMKVAELATRFKGAQQQAAAQQLVAQAQNKYGQGMANLTALVQQRDARLASASRSGSKMDQTQRLFKNALIGARKLLTMWKGLDPTKSRGAGLLGFFGPKIQQAGSAKQDVLYNAQVQNVAQNINKAFSGARGSDRDLAAVLLQMPDQSVFLLPGGQEKGEGLILQLIDNLESAQVAEDGRIVKDAFANSMVSSGNLSEAKIQAMIKTEEFKKFKTFVLEGK